MQMQSNAVQKKHRTN